MALMISNDTGKAFAKIVNQFLLQTLRVLKKKMKSVYQKEQQIFTNDKEKCLSFRTQPSTAIAL